MVCKQERKRERIVETFDPQSQKKKRNTMRDRERDVNRDRRGKKIGE